MMVSLVDRQTIVIINKIDLPVKTDEQYIGRLFPQENIVRLSARENEGINRLERAVTAIFFSGNLDSGDMTYVSNARHIHLLKKAIHSLDEALQAVEMRVPIDMIQIDIRNAWEQLGEIIGDAVSDSLIDQIFSQFCLGK